MTEPSTTPGPWSSAPLVAQPLPILGTLGLTWSIFRQAPWAFLGISAVPLLLSFAGALLRVMARAQGYTGALAVLIFVALLVQIVVQVIFQMACMVGAWRIRETGRFPVSESLRTATQRFWAVVGLSILQVLIIVIGLLLLIIPGLIAIFTLIASTPACLIEGLGPVASLKRSRALTFGHRWRILGLFLALMGFAVALMLVFILIGMALIVAAKAAADSVGVQVFGVLLAVLELPLLAGIVALGSILPTAIYAQLLDRSAPAAR